MCFPLMLIQLRSVLTKKLGADAVLEKWAILVDDMHMNNRIATFGRWLRNTRMLAEGRQLQVVGGRRELRGLSASVGSPSIWRIRSER